MSVRQMTTVPEDALTEDGVEEMLALAERLRRQNGGNLDDSAIQAVAEATGAPVDYVRLAVKIRADKKRRSLVTNLRAQFFTLEPDTRRYVSSGLLGTLGAFLTIFDSRLGELTQVYNDSSYGIFSMLALVVAMLGLYNLAISRETRVAAIGGAILSGAYFVARSVFGFLMLVKLQVQPAALFPVVALGAGLGVVANRLFTLNRKKLGLRDPVQDRQELLEQLHSLRDQLQSGEKSMAFLSVDVVGSTKMKQNADPLAVEFTFTEYHHYVERIARKHSGSVHSTAGDGVICAFEDSHSAFTAAKNLQAELLELNLLRNKLGVPITLRCGVHSGKVLAPDVNDVRSLNFAEVIDIAAHLQDICPPGGVVISQPAVAEMGQDLRSIGKSTELDGMPAGVWLPRTSLSVGAATPPPLPN